MVHGRGYTLKCNSSIALPCTREMLSGVLGSSTSSLRTITIFFPPTPTPTPTPTFPGSLSSSQVCRRKLNGYSFSNTLNTNKRRLHQLSILRRREGTIEEKKTLVSSSNCSKSFVCKAQKTLKPSSEDQSPPEETIRRRILQFLLWAAEGVYIFWLFLLPYAPGDPVWAISSDTINSLVGLSLNFFFILPLVNSVGFRLIDAPILHPISEGLFNFVIAWTFMFAPLLFTDCRRDRYKGSLDILWGFQMFLTNTFLIPYMAIRLNEVNPENVPRKPSQLESVMIKGAGVVGVIGGGVCILSALWALFGRMDGNFGTLKERFEFLVSYLGSERLAYAFIWDICLYLIFQPWLIGDNLENVEDGKVGVVRKLRFIPVLGLVAFLLCLDPKEEF